MAQIYASKTNEIQKYETEKENGGIFCITLTGDQPEGKGAYGGGTCPCRGMYGPFGE